MPYKQHQQQYCADLITGDWTSIHVYDAPFQDNQKDTERETGMVLITILLHYTQNDYLAH